MNQSIDNFMEQSCLIKIHIMKSYKQTNKQCTKLKRYFFDLKKLHQRKRWAQNGRETMNANECLLKL